MDVDTPRPADSLVSLREELKTWEREFSIQHDGRKPSQDDIRNNADASAKYRLYNKLKRSQTQPTHTPRKKRKILEDASHTREALQERNPNIRAASPQKIVLPAKEEQIRYEEPEVLPTPAFIRCALGPTPQKDGQVLGIFDFMPSVTPSKDAPLPAVPSDTPSKPMVCPPTKDLSATPRSSTKRKLFSAFTGTPQKRKRADEPDTPSTSRRQYATPSFLRRNAFMPAIPEDDEQSAPLPFKKRSVVRSLSSMIQGLRNQEEERLDDELDILNELEAEALGEPIRKKPKVLVENSQGVDMPLGPDKGAVASDEESDDDPLDARDQPRKPWKKKGLKRQTKRVIMRPVTHKPARIESQVERVPETQVVEPIRDLADNYGRQSDSDAAYDDKDNDKASTARLQKKEKPAGSKPTKEDGALKKVAKKVSATAHANFRRLKIKNKNSKANGRGKFGRRR